jgi:hypothetical protein
MFDIACCRTLERILSVCRAFMVLRYRCEKRVKSVEYLLRQFQRKNKGTKTWLGFGDDS